MNTGNRWHAPNPVGAGIVCALAVLVLLPGTSSAQSLDAQPQDLKFEIINATTGEPGTVDRMTIDYVTQRRNNVANFEPDGSAFTARGVPILEGGKYIITVWYQSVPYWWSKRGRELAPGVTTLHVFDTASTLDQVVMSGMNLVIRRQESLLRLEYMLQVTNNSSPQTTILDRPGTFEIALPREARDIQATYNRGPDPMAVPVGSPGRGTTLEVPLTPGPNQIRIEAVVPWTDGMELPVGSNLAVEAWSVLASPEMMDVQSTDIEENSREKVAGFRRFVGSPLDPGEAVDLRLDSGVAAAASTEDLFTGEAPAEQEAATEDASAEQGGGMTLPLILVGVLIIVVIAAAARRRRS